jgi:hypothetical protein
MVGSFIYRRVQPCQRRVHSGYEYQGNADTTWMKKERIDEAEIHRRINKLFNLADCSFMPSNDRMHAYKLARPPPKVTRI